MRPSPPLPIAISLALPAVVVLALVLPAQEPAAPTDGRAAPPMAGLVRAGEYWLSGPFAHDNLTVFLIHGEDRLPGRTFLTLAEALEQKKFVINETQAVNQLVMENLSPTEDVIILSGDILKGGQQDRFAQYDLVVPAKSGQQPLPAFCVEHTATRWMRDLKGNDRNFDESPGQVVSNSTRLAARYQGGQDTPAGRDGVGWQRVGGHQGVVGRQRGGQGSNVGQGAVWNEVARVQRQLRMNVSAEVRVKGYEDSLALSVQVKEVRAAVDQYASRLATLVEGKGDVVGFAYAINGKVTAADVYGSPALFRKVWPRLLQATATEAVAEQEKGKKFAPAPAADVQAFLAETATKTKADSTQDVGKAAIQLTTDGVSNVRFETQDVRMKAKGSYSYLRRNYLAKK